MRFATPERGRFAMWESSIFIMTPLATFDMDEKKFHPELSTSEKLINKEQALLLYCTNNCDCEKTAFALGIDAVCLQRVIDSEKWDERLGAIREKMKGETAGSIERGINRSLNFCMAHRFRLLLEKALQVMENWTDEELRTAMTSETTSKAGKTSYRVSTRWAGDFSSALEKMAAMSYAATNDSATERVKRREEEGSGESKIDIHQRIAAAMSGVATSKSPRHLLLEAQLEVADHIAQKAIVIKPPPNDEFEGDEAGG